MEYRYHHQKHQYSSAIPKWGQRLAAMNPPESMDTSSSDLENLRKLQLADAEGFRHDKKSCKLTTSQVAPPIHLSNSFQVLDTDSPAARMWTDSPSESQSCRMPPIIARLKVVTQEDIKLTKSVQLERYVLSMSDMDLG